MLHNYDDIKDNKKLSGVSLGVVFGKAGSYIMNMGAVNFFEYLIINLMLIVHVARK